MTRIRWYCAGILGVLIGCRDSGTTPQPVPPAPRPAESPKAPAAGGKSEEKGPVSGLNARDIKAVEVRSGNGLTRIGISKDAAVPVDFERDRPRFYPVLRNFDEGDLFRQKVAHAAVAKGLGVFACRKTKGPNGRTGIDYVMKDQLADYGVDEPKMIELCYDNFFKEKIEVKALKQADDVMLSFSSTGGLVTALLGHASTYEKLSDMLTAETIAVMIDGPDILLATPRGSSFEAKFYEIVKRSRHKNSPVNLDPAVYHWTKKDGLTRAEEPPAD